MKKNSYCWHLLRYNRRMGQETIFLLILERYFLLAFLISMYFVVVFVHELGHLLVAKIVGLRVEKFCIFGDDFYLFNIFNTRFYVGIDIGNGYIHVDGSKVRGPILWWLTYAAGSGANMMLTVYSLFFKLSEGDIINFCLLYLLGAISFHNGVVNSLLNGSDGERANYHANKWNRMQNIKRIRNLDKR